MLINTIDAIKPRNILGRPHIGLVIDNADPTRRGKIKVDIKGLLEFSVDELPWIYPVAPTFLGGSGASLSFAVPEVGSYVQVLFPYDDIAIAFYQGHWISPKEALTTFNDDYPESYGYEDSSGNWFRHNKASKITEFHHNSGTHIKILADGTIDILCSDKIVAKTSGDMTFDIGGKFSVTTAGNFEVNAGAACDINAATNYTVDAGGSITETAGGIHKSAGSGIAHG